MRFEGIHAFKQKKERRMKEKRAEEKRKVKEKVERKKVDGTFGRRGGGENLKKKKMEAEESPNPERAAFVFKRKGIDIFFPSSSPSKVD